MQEDGDNDRDAVKEIEKVDGTSGTAYIRLYSKGM
jgi:hypothetical protein